VFSLLIAMGAIIVYYERGAVKLQKQREEREFLLREIHHRVKNNLQLVTSLLSLQSATLKDPAALEQFEKSKNRIHALALVHHTIFAENAFSKVNVENYIADLTTYLISEFALSGKKVEVLYQIEPASLNLDTIIPMGLILNELLTNSMKHGFKDRPGGEITIDFSLHGCGSYLLKVSDSGCGLPRGFNSDNSTQLGLTLVNSLVEQLDGSIKMENRHQSPVRGAEVTIFFHSQNTQTPNKA